jgi:hypothetical protein
MPFDWREFLIVAHGLRNDPKEAAQRTCLGRAYYYVFNLGLTNARTLSFKEGMPSLHRKLWDWCQQHKNPMVKQMGICGSRMHSFRIDADYNDPVSNLAGKVKTQLSRAQEFETLVARSNGTTPPAPLGP